MSCDWFVTKWFFVYQVLTTRKAVMQSTLKGTLERGQCCWALRNWTPCHQDYCTWTHCTSTGEVMGRVRRHLPASWFMSVFSTLHPLWWTSAWNTTILHCVCSFPKISQRSLLQMSLPLISTLPSQVPNQPIKVFTTIQTLCTSSVEAISHSFKAYIQEFFSQVCSMQQQSVLS